jgi:toxin ParE1/3/4
MNGDYRQRREARQDLVAIFRLIAREGGLRTARRFLTEAEATFQRLANLPNIGTAFEPGELRFAGLRYASVSSRFKKFLVFYRPLEDGIEVLRVLHGSRDLGSILAGDAEEGIDENPGDE